MKEFNAKLSESADQVTLEITGSIDASGKFPSVITQKPLVIRFDDVAMMNSYGIKIWCKWSVDHQHLPKIFLDNCPFVFAKNFGSIRGFLMPNMHVRSFYVPFYNDESHEAKNVLMTIGKDFTDDGFYNVPKAFDSKGAPMEIDVDKKTYFQFLKKS